MWSFKTSRGSGVARPAGTEQSRPRVRDRHSLSGGQPRRALKAPDRLQWISRQQTERKLLVWVSVFAQDLAFAPSKSLQPQVNEGVVANELSKVQLSARAER